MVQYTNRTVRLGEAGLVQSITRGVHDFLYRVSTIKDPKWNVGDEVEIGGGRKAVYALSTGANELFASHGCEFSHTGYTTIVNFVVAAAVGDTEITIPVVAHGELEKDELAGGFVIIFDGVTDLYTTTRMITGNDAAADGALFKVRLDAELTYAVSTTSKCEVFKNPYSAIVVASDASKPKAGIPMAYVSDDANYFWVQKAGICWIPPQTSNVGENGGLGCYWRHDGSLEGTEVTLGALTVPVNDTSQYAGHVIAGSQAGNGPLFMLQG